MTADPRDEGVRPPTHVLDTLTPRKIVEECFECRNRFHKDDNRTWTDIRLLSDEEVAGYYVIHHLHQHPYNGVVWRYVVRAANVVRAAIHVLNRRDEDR